MNKEELSHRDQAERLRKRIAKKQEEPVEQGLSDELPPRSEVHQQKKKKTKVKLKYPIIRLLALFFILLPIVSFSLYTINDNKKTNGTEPVSNNQSNFETVDFEETEDPEDNTVVEEEEVDEVKAKGDSNATQEVNIPATKHYTSDKGSIKESDKNSNDKGTTEKILYHKVQPNETLFRIAMKYYHSQTGIEIIKQANGIQNNEIQVGQTLKIPTK